MTGPPPRSSEPARDRGGASRSLKGLPAGLVALLGLGGPLSYLVLPGLIGVPPGRRLQVGSGSFGAPALLRGVALYPPLRPR